MYAGQQVRILGENYTLEDEEDSKIGQVRYYHSVIYTCTCNGPSLGVWSVNVSNPLGHVRNVCIKVPQTVIGGVNRYISYLPFPGNERLSFQLKLISMYVQKLITKGNNYDIIINT